MSDVKALEHCTLKVPYEVLNKKFRNAQKVIDREVSHVSSAVNDLNSLSSKETVTVKEASRALDDAVEKLKVLKRKAKEALVQEEDSTKNCKTRLDHIKEYDSPRRSVQHVWKRTRLDRMLVDYFLRSGYYETAIKLSQKAGIERFVDIDLFLTAKQVEDALRAKNSAPCLSWCHDNKSRLRKVVKSTLELNVRIQEFVELVKVNKRLEAVMYARKHFATAGGECNTIPDIQKTMALLAFNSDTECPRYKELFDEHRWEKLVDQFRQENFALHQLHKQSMLEITLQCGLASLKTPHCYHDDSKSRDCPVCCRLFNDLARPLPFAHCAQSRLICSITGEPMDEHNAPLCLPNGFVYGENALQASAILSDDSLIQCHRTKEKFRLEEANKVFVM